MPSISIHISTEIVTANNLHELVDLIQALQRKDGNSRIITLTCSVTSMCEQSLESPAIGVPTGGYDGCRFVQHYDETVGLWVIDENPQEVDIEWIRKHAYQIGITDTDS